MLLRGWDPVAQGSVFAPGPGVSETLRNGITYVNDDPTDHSFASPRYVYRLEPGKAFTYLVSVRNNGPLPFRLLGLPKPSLPRDEIYGWLDLRSHAGGHGFTTCSSS